MFQWNIYLSVYRRRSFYVIACSVLDSQAPVTPELATRRVFQLSKLCFSSYSKTVKKYTPQIECCGFFWNCSFLCKTPVELTKRLKILDCDFTYYGVYSFGTFGVCLNLFMFNHSKTSFKTFIVIQNYIWLILNHLFAYFLENLIWFKSCKYVLAEMFWLRFTGWWLVIGKVFGKYLAQSVAIKHFYTRNQTRPRKIPFCTSSQKQIPRNRNHPFSFIVLQI